MGRSTPLEVKKVIADYPGAHVLRSHSNQERSQLADGRPIGVPTLFPAVAATLSVGGPDHLARYDTAAEQEGHGVRPVIMARLNDAGAPHCRCWPHARL